MFLTLFCIGNSNLIDFNRLGNDVHRHVYTTPQSSMDSIGSRLNRLHYLHWIFENKVSTTGDNTWLNEMVSTTKAQPNYRLNRYKMLMTKRLTTIKTTVNTNVSVDVAGDDSVDISVNVSIAVSVNVSAPV